MPKDLQMPDGTVITGIPDEYTSDQMKAVGNKYLLNKPGTGNSFQLANPKSPTPIPNDPTKGMVESGVKQGLGQILPLAGSFIGPEGTLAGSAIKSLLPESYGGSRGGLGEQLTNMGEDILGQEVLPRAAGGILGKLKTLVTKGPSAAIAESIANTWPLNKSPSVKGAIAQDTIDNQLKPQVDTLLGQPKSPNAIDAYGVPRDPLKDGIQNQVERKTVTSLFSNSGGFKPTSGKLDPDKILDEFDKPGQDYSAISKDTKGSIVDLMNAVKKQQETAETGKPGGIIKYVQHRLVFDSLMAAPSAAFGSFTGHEAMGLGASGALVLGDVALSKLMSNPAMAKLVVVAAKTAPSNQAAPLLQKAILAGLGGGTEVYLQTPDGLQKGEIQNGQFQLPRQGQ